MRQSLILISLLLLFTHLFAQKKSDGKVRRSPKDTAFIIVQLPDIDYSKTLIIEVGEKAEIFLSGDSIINEASQHLSNDFVKDEYRRIIKFLNSAFKHDDTVVIEFDKLPNLEYLISHQLQMAMQKFSIINKTDLLTVFHTSLKDLEDMVTGSFIYPTKGLFLV